MAAHKKKICPSASDDVSKYVILRRTIDVAEKGVALCIGYKLLRAVHCCDVISSLQFRQRAVKIVLVYRGLVCPVC